MTTADEPKKVTPPIVKLPADTEVKKGTVPIAVKPIDTEIKAQPPIVKKPIDVDLFEQEKNKKR